MSFNSPLCDTFYLSVCFLRSLPFSPSFLLHLSASRAPLLSHPSVLCCLSLSLFLSQVFRQSRADDSQYVVPNCCVCMCVCQAIAHCTWIIAEANHWHLYMYFTLCMNNSVHIMLLCSTLLLDMCSSNSWLIRNEARTQHSTWNLSFAYFMHSAAFLQSFYTPLTE